VEPWREVQLQSEPSAAQTRSMEDVDDIKCSVNLAELTDEGSVVAVTADEDIHYNYCLLKVISNGVVTLDSDFKDDLGSVFSCGQRVLLGHFFHKKT